MQFYMNEYLFMLQQWEIARQISTPLLVLRYGHTTLLNHDGRVTSLQHQSSFDSRPPRAEKFKPVTCLLNHCDRSFSSSKVEFIRVIVWSNEVWYMRNIWSKLLIFPKGS